MMRAVQRGTERISEADRTVGAKYFGASVPRREDPRLLRGEGRFVDDMKLPGMLHAAFVRSPHAHARITAIRTDARGGACGARVFTFADLARFMKPLPLFGAVPPGLAARVDVTMKQAPQFALCRDVVRYVGEIVAMVLAESRALAEDAAELVEVDYEPLPASSPTWWRRLEPGAPLIHAEVPTTSASISARASAMPRRALAEADVRVRERVHVQRYVGMPIETRGRGRAVGPRDGASRRGTARRSSTSSSRGSSPRSGCPPTRSGSSRPTWAAASAPRPTATRRTC